MPITKAQVEALSQALGLPSGYTWNLAVVVQSLQNGEVSGDPNVPAAQGFAPGAVNQALRIGTASGTVAVAGTPVNTGAVGAGITPIANAYWVATGPEGAAIASYSGGADGTFAVNAAATGAVTVAFLY